MRKKYDLIILISCYLRTDTLEKLLESLESKDFAHIFFAVDGPKRDIDITLNNSVLSLINKFTTNTSFTVLHSKKNLGPFENLKRGLEEVFFYFDSVVYLEDDVIVSKDFFDFMELAKTSLNTNHNLKLACGFLPLDIRSENKVFLSKSLSTSAHMIYRSSYFELIDLYTLLLSSSENDFLVKVYNEGYLQSGNYRWLKNGIKKLYKDVFFNYELLTLLMLSKKNNFSIFPNRNLISIDSFSKFDNLNFNSPSALILLPKKIQSIYKREIEKFVVENTDFENATYYPLFDKEWSKIKGEGYYFKKLMLRLETLVILLKNKEFKLLLRALRRKLYDIEKKI
jgi:hypothetical protein